MTCQSCKHWHKLPADPTNLGAPAVGECRGVPPSLIHLGGGNITSMYQRLPAQFPSCGMYQLPLRLSVGICHEEVAQAKYSQDG